jgi:hypothetical protein
VEDREHQRIAAVVVDSSGAVAVDAQLCGHCRLPLRRSCARSVPPGFVCY